VETMWVNSRHRLIVERTHAHFNNWRGIFVRWNKKVKKLYSGNLNCRYILHTEVLMNFDRFLILHAF